MSKCKSNVDDGDYSFISSDSDDFKWINFYAEGNIEIGLSLGDDYLDEYFRYKKEFVIPWAQQCREDNLLFIPYGEQ